MPSLTRAEATARAALIAVDAVDVDLDLDRGAELFGSRTTIRFTSRTPGASTFVDLRPRALHAVTLNGRPLDPASLVDGRLELTDLAADNVLEVEATMAYSHDGQGLHRSADPADGEHYVYGHLFLDAAPTVFACFDQPDLKAPYTVAVTAPEEWTVLGNGAATRRRPGPHRAGDHPAARDVLRHGVRRAVRRPCAPSTTASRWGSMRGGRSSRTCASRPSSCSRPPGTASTTTTGCSASGTRSGSTTRCSSRSSTPGRWRTPAA